MPQILKEDVRERIIESAKQEFLDKGYQNANMRSIAKKSEMTVGNLYRYFRNKEDINTQIVSPVILLIDKLVGKLTQGEISLLNDKFEFSVDKKSLREKLDLLVDELVEIYLRHPIEFNILMMHSDINDKVTEWFANLIKYLIMENYNIHIKEDLVLILSRGYARGICNGLKEIFAMSKVDKETLTVIVRVYVRSYLGMLDSDLGKYLGE